jgi:hypothetical protein
LLINNTAANEDILLYKDAPTADNPPFAGVRAGEQGWGVKDAPNGLYVLYAATQQEYNANPGNPKVAMARLVYVDETPVTYDMGAGEVGNAAVTFRNQSEHYIEIYSEGFDGQFFYTVRPYEFGNTKYAPGGNYSFFPVVKTEQKLDGKTIALYSRFDTAGSRVIGLNAGGAPVLYDVTPGEGPDDLKKVEVLIYIRNNFDNGGGGSEVHIFQLSDGSTGPLVKSTLGREIANLGETFVISWRPELDPATGEPVSPTFNAYFVLVNANGKSTFCGLACRVGKSYTVNIDAAGAVQFIEDADL